MLGHSALSTNPLNGFGALQSTSIVGAGGLAASGVATAKRAATRTGSGGLLASGAAGILRGYVLVSAGGLLAGGAAGIVRELGFVGSGGLLAGGTGSPVGFRPVTPGPYFLAIDEETFDLDIVVETYSLHVASA